MTQLLRVQNFNVSQDGFGAGDNQCFERPFGDADPGEMFAWAGATASWPNRTDPGGTRGLDDYFTRDFANNIGAEIMGRNKFGPQRGPWADHVWQGWWGEEPPFHTPVFVLTHHRRPSFTLSDTTFHFIDAGPEAALALAREAAQGKDVRLGGGASTVREFLDAGLIDTLHVAVSPNVTIGSGSRLWESPEELLDRYHLEVVPSSSGVLHHLFWRR
ncbi:dihydrofolate reductase family protein [Mycolicibacterium goodii]|uniref:Dihydrofolate reductase family protein n=1 Tax=Mycolicibacterium goodii TaxID=134601 RepID=A0ABS6HVL1_MYCGD|nr:dihydrofolate reductase family protein [Mycolicibacterium goodii]OKH62962.1 deaminase/reductase [Mycobacterium sp. SWH-M5]MBU8813147.1 dihydrofolate reductase family protein [Mycolicibacterium goodii]MBU8816704.1 dihydrofolate reductase family protein [Mycolicibacterium goodii]MBU8826263.1 dihydrofolate reductase family protein [Mycolicibacterium goodii]MBU8828849.1 dihydrofolate reductase family protein [Mycolicibacterium goodii]